MEAHDWLAPASCSSCFDIRLFLFSFVSMVLIIFRQNAHHSHHSCITSAFLSCRIHRQRLGPSGSRRLRDSRFSSKCSKSVKRPSWNEKYENPGVKKPSAWLCLLPKHKRRDTLSLLSLLLLHHRPHLHVTFVTFVTSPFRICNSQRLAHLFKEHYKKLYSFRPLCCFQKEM